MKFLMHVIALALITYSAMGQEWEPVLTEDWDPVPVVITPGVGTAPPSDAIVLFDGSGFDHWIGMDGNPVQWALEDSVMTIVPKTQGICTRDSFGDVQLHIE